jgi:hypothetical protein
MAGGVSGTSPACGRGTESVNINNSIGTTIHLIG